MWNGSLRALGLAAVLCSGLAHGQNAAPSVDSSGSAANWQGYNWLSASDAQQRQAASGDSVSVKSSQDLNDPFTAISSDSLWQDKTDATYTHKVDDALSFSYQTSDTTLSGEGLSAVPLASDSDYDLSRGQTFGMQFQPVADVFTLNGNVHSSSTDAALPSDSYVTNGAALTAQSHLPLSNGVLTLGLNTDQSAADINAAPTTTTTAYDAQYQQPLGKLPLTAVVKGHYEQMTITGEAPSSLPSMEQSLLWKPMDATSLQMGLRQQQYQEYPGIANEFNEALFADWSQKMAANVSWHSYAEVMNTRGMIDQAPAAPIASGANGTPQATTPGSQTSLTNNLPLSLDDQTITFTTGPSFQIQKDISASLEYSNRWDKNPSAGNTGQEQRLSVSVKGSF